MKKSIDLGQMLWQVTMASQDLERLDNNELFELYKRAYAAHCYSLEDGVSEAERRWALKVFEDVEIETIRRHMTIVAAFVYMDPDGHFISGREDLKNVFAQMTFDERLDFADGIRAGCETEAQRLAILEVEREVVMMEN